MGYIPPFAPLRNTARRREADAGHAAHAGHAGRSERRSERRVDPDDNQLYSWEELRRLVEVWKIEWARLVEKKLV